MHLRNIIILSGILAVTLLPCSQAEHELSTPSKLPLYPEKFAALYKELSTNLSRRENELRAGWDGVRAPVIYAATLLSANSNNGSKLLNPSFRAVNRLILKRLARLGVQGIVLQINYPLLTSNFSTDAPAYLAAFREIADEIRALGLKVIVEHNVLLPGFSSLNPRRYYLTLSKRRFGRESYAEIRAIVEQVKPDYLSLVTEPGTFEAAVQLHMSVADWEVYVKKVIARLSIDLPAYTTKLGAGSGAWEQPGFVTAFANIAGLDFIDIHSYPLTNNVTDYLKVLERWPAMVRAINPSLEIISSESWLYKARISELGRTPINPRFFARDVYSFWEPLDAQFLDVIAITAHKNNFSVIAPFWSNYFFAYLDYNDPALSGLTPSEIQRRAFLASYRAVQEGRTTKLGKHYSELINGTGRPISGKAAFNAKDKVVLMRPKDYRKNIH